MTKEDILSDVQNIFRDVFDDEELIVKEETNSNDIEDWDSLAQVRLSVAIEKKFRVKFDFGELKSLNNVGDMLMLINKKMK